MSRAETPPAWIDPVFRSGAAVVTALFVGRILYNYAQNTDRRILIFWLISELISLVTIIISRKPSVRDINPAYMVMTCIASFLAPLFIGIDHNPPLISEFAGEVMTLIGLAWIIYAKISLGRSFGLLAAKREVKVQGAYRFIRHPIYAGYFVTHVAILLTNFSLLNLLLIVILYSMQVLRALREERILSTDETYRAYCGKTRYRFIYGIF